MTERQTPLLERVKAAPVPAHIGVIMDGNGRWAKNKNLPRTMGHKEGLTATKRIVRAAAQAGVKYMTLYAFSTENWKRAQEEVGFLMNLILTHLRGEFAFYKKNKVRIRHLGSSENLPPEVRGAIKKVEEQTADFNGLTVALAINYGGRDEIIRAAKKIAASGDPEAFSEQNLSSYFDVPELPDMDLLVRTGGEKRLSNFMLWHSAYAELAFSDTLWPDFSEDEFYGMIIDFQHRNRRFGGVTNV